MQPRQGWDHTLRHALDSGIRQKTEQPKEEQACQHLRQANAVKTWKAF